MLTLDLSFAPPRKLELGVDELRCRIYRWCPECVVVECNCGKMKTFSRSELIKAESACECGTDNTTRVREDVVLELADEDYEVHHHPWRYWHPRVAA
jgi:hypothetical protein